jgi:hypothetical protein
MMTAETTSGEELNPNGYQTNNVVTHLNRYPWMDFKFTVELGDQVVIHGGELEGVTASVHRITVMNGPPVFTVTDQFGEKRVVPLLDIYWKFDGSLCQPIMNLFQLIKTPTKAVVCRGPKDSQDVAGALWVSIGRVDYEYIDIRFTGWVRVAKGRLDDGNWPQWNILTGERLLQPQLPKESLSTV